MSTPNTETLTGRCICGAIKYEVQLPMSDGAPPQILCHCIFCKRYSGGCFARGISTSIADFAVVSGEPKKYVYQQAPNTPKPFDENPTMYFCDNCGCQIYSENKALPGSVFIKVGTLDRQAEFTKVRLQLNCENESTWLEHAMQQQDNKFDTFPPMGPPKQ